jgi:adenylate cyclase
VDDGYAAAHTAITIDPSIAEAHCVTARRLEEHGREQEALAELRKGLALNPDSWELNKALANFFMARGQVEDATRHFEKAVEVMETDYHAWGMLMTCYHGLGDIARVQDAAKVTLQQVEEVLAKDPSNGAAISMGVSALGDIARVQDAAKVTLQQVEEVLAKDPSNGAAISMGVSALGAIGEEQRAREWMERALLIDPDNLNMRYNFACALARDLGDPEGALHMLESSLSRIRGSLGNAEFDPDFESIRADPRFGKIISTAKERLGIAQPAFGNPAAPAAVKSTNC